MATKKTNKQRKQNEALLRLVIMVAIILCVNVLASFFHKGIDLTKENRFTLSQSTKKLLHDMQEVAVIDVYLKGEKFPAEMQRMQEAVRERLQSFKDIAGNKIVYRFIDPLEGKTQKEQTQIAHDMEQKGMRYFQLTNKSEDDFSMRIFYPFALVHYNGKEVPVMLLEDPPSQSAAAKISYAEATLEYKFASAINQLNHPDVTRIAYIVGHGENQGINSLDMLMTLPKYYQLDTVDLTHVLKIPSIYRAIIVNQPVIPFNGSEKLKLDQYIMHGGHALWVVNSLQTSMDSLAHAQQFIAMDMGLNLDDLLFKYGVRINPDLVEDMQCAKIPFVSNNKIDLHQWVYFPRFNPSSEHAIVRNMDFILGGFTNTIDTIKSEGIDKTILLQSSKYSRSANAPMRVSLSMMNFPLKAEMFNKPYRNVAVLLEGKFHSVYQNRLAPEYMRLLDSLKVPFKPVCDRKTSMIVTSVQNIFASDYTTKDGILPVGYYRYTNEFFANKNFLLNCLEYLTDTTGIFESRSKEVKVRLLDAGRAKDEKGMWQAINIGVPIAAVLIFSSCFIFFRKRRYEVKMPSTTKKTLSTDA